MNIRRNKFLIAIIIVSLLSLAMVGCSSSNDSDQTEKNQTKTTDTKKDTIKIGLNNWAENIAVSNMWKLILEEKGYTVELVNGEKAIIYTGVNKGDLDLGLEVWLPTTDEPYWNEYKEGLDKIGPWYEGTKLGLVVPSYMEINSIEELTANKDQFDGEILGIEPGTSLMRMTEEAVDAYELDYKLIDGSETAMMASLKANYEKKQPVLVTLWSPHWAFADFELKYLEDPKKVFGDEEVIYAMANKDFKEKYPDVNKWLSQWKMDDQSLGSLMAVINDSGDPAVGAQKWLDNNRELVEEWLK